jgi:hypothetical protein
MKSLFKVTLLATTMALALNAIGSSLLMLPKQKHAAADADQQQVQE